MDPRLLAACFFLWISCVVPAYADDAGATSAYTHTEPSRDGIGKRYLGREISHVMGHRGAAWLERPERERQERTDLLITNLPLTSDSVVADIGAGTGYFTFPVAALVPDGRVLAVDIQPEMLRIIEQRKVTQGIKNVQSVQGAIDNPNLPANSLDLAFIVDAYHEFSHPLEMGQSIATALKPGGALVLIEYRAEDRTVPIKRLHKMSQTQVRKEMDVLGLQWESTADFLPQQHFMIFRKPLQADL